MKKGAMLMSRGLMLNKKVWAVVGVTPSKEKFGYKVWNLLKNKGYQVYAINPKYDEIEGDKCYSSLKALPVIPEVVDLVVPPTVSGQVIDEAHQLGINYLWFQPGTSNIDIIDKAKSLGIVTVNDCVLVALDGE